MMLDDEVEYIGTRVAPKASLASDSLAPQQPVTGERGYFYMFSASELTCLQD